MTKKQFEIKTKHLAKQLKQSIIDECLRLYDSGAVNPKDFENDFELPKIIMCASLQNEPDQYEPFLKTSRSIVTNLLKF